VQPDAFATHTSALPVGPQRVAPAVHWLLQVKHWPLVQVLCAPQLVVVHVVQPRLVSTWQVWRCPPAVQTEVPAVQASRQQVAVFAAMVLSVDESCAWLVAT
jgi:hypothetical protein